MTETADQGHRPRYAVRGPRCTRERDVLQAFVSRRNDVDWDWFEAADDEALGEALHAETNRGCLFADLDAAMDAAIADRLRLNEITRDDVVLLLADAPANPADSMSLSAVLRSASRTAASRRRHQTVRQTIAGMILSAILLAAIAGLMLTGPS